MTNELFLQKEIAPLIEGEALLNACTIIYPSANSKLIIYLSKGNTRIRYFKTFAILELSKVIEL